MDNRLKYIAVAGLVTVLLIAVIATYIQQQNLNEQFKQENNSHLPDVNSTGTLIPNPNIANTSNLVMMGKLYMGHYGDPATTALRPYNLAINATLYVTQGNSTLPIAIYSNDSWAYAGTLAKNETFTIKMITHPSDGQSYSYISTTGQVNMDSMTYLYDGSQYYAYDNIRHYGGYTDNITTASKQLDLNLENEYETGTAI